MWTHVRPYKKLSTTRERIEYWGDQELNHALHLGRLVGFVGSGVTTAYGRLTWGEFCRLIVMSVDELFRSRKNSNLPTVDISNAIDLHRALAHACGQKIVNDEDTVCPTLDKKFNVDTSLLELCAELSEALGEKQFVKQATKKIMMASPLLQFESRLILLDGNGDDSLYREWRESLKSFFCRLKKNGFEWKCFRSEEQTVFQNEMSVEQAVCWFFNLCEEKKQKKIKAESKRRKKIALSFSIDKIQKNITAEIEEQLDTSCLHKILGKINKHGYLTTIHIGVWEFLKKGSKSSRKKLYPIIFCLLIQEKEGAEPWFLERFFDESERKKIKELDRKWPHPIKHIVETLGIRRILTLNYDLEIEKYFENERGFKAESWFKTVENGDNNSLERNFSTTDGYGDRFYSVTPNKINASDLIDFVALADHHDAYVFHLHGRADCEQDLIITEYDYQKRYVRDSKTRQAFDEGMRTLFAGNDVLFLGIGMNEADLFRPMRQFMSDGRRFVVQQDGIIALLGERKFSNVESDKTLSELASSEKKSTRLQIEYGVKTLYFGLGEKHTELKDENVAHLKELENFSKEKRKQKLLSWMRNDRESTRLQSEAFVHALVTKAALQEKWFNNWIRRPQDRYGLLRDYTCSKELSLSNKKRQNNLDVSTQYCPRWIRQKSIDSLGGDSQTSGVAELEDVIFERIQQEIVSAYKAEKTSDIINNITTKGHRIVRIMGARGKGKGTFIRKLQNNYADFLPDMTGNWSQETVNDEGSLKYSGSFFVDTRYSTEFNSVISSFIRFLAGRIAHIKSKNRARDLKRVREAEYEPLAARTKKYLLGEEFADIGRLKLLKRYMDAYAECANHANERLFICLSGLDRIVNDDGYGYNALHRAFFRILTGAGEITDISKKVQIDLLTDDEKQELSETFSKTPPFDIILISKKTDVPIRYLSEYINFDLKHGDDSVVVTTQQAVLQRWYLLPLQEYEKNPLEDLFSEVRTKKITSSKKELLKEKFSALHKLLHANFFLRMIIVRFVELDCGELAAKKESNYTASFIEEKKERLIEKLNFAAARNGIDGVLEIVFRAYYAFDVEEKCEEFASLVALVLRRLVIFSMPIQRAVLADFPAIRSSIVKLIEMDKRFSGRSITERCLSEWLYDEVLRRLFLRNLVIAIEHDGLGRNRYESRRFEKNNSKERVFEKLSPAEGYQRFVLHSIIREHLAKRMRYAAFDHGEHSFFDVSLYSTQPRDLPSPSSQDYREVGRVLQDMIDFSRNYLNAFYQFERHDGDFDIRKKVLDTIINNDTLHVVSHKLRAGLNLVSGSFSIGVISRLLDETGEQLDFGGEALKPYDSYRGWIRGLINGAVALDQTDKVYQKLFNKDANQNDDKGRQRQDSRNAEFEEISDFIQNYHIQKPFYRTEIAWLYNERGLVSLVQGRLFDAITFFDSALEQITSDHWVSPEKYESTAARSSLRKVTINRALAILEAGKIKEAHDILLKLHNELDRKKRYIPNLTLYLAKGYLGLCHHLAGRKNNAEKFYAEALEYFENKPNHMRTVAIFRRHLADLYRGMNYFDKSRKLINQSISIASSAEQQDILHHAYVSKAHVIRWSGGRISKAMKLLEKAELYASKMGIPKLVVDCYTAKGEIMIEQNQYGSAGKFLTDAIAISNKHGMNLRKIGALRSYANLLRKRGVDDSLLRRMQTVTKALSEKTGLLHVPEEPELRQ